MNLLLIVFANYVVDQQLAIQLLYIFDTFLDKTKLKDDSCNDADWVRDLSIILIVAQKNYVLGAPLGDRPATGADTDIKNVWVHDNLVRHALRLSIGAPKTFQMPWNI